MLRIESFLTSTYHINFPFFDVQSRSVHCREVMWKTLTNQSRLPRRGMWDSVSTSDFVFMTPVHGLSRFSFRSLTLSRAASTRTCHWPSFVVCPTCLRRSYPRSRTMITTMPLRSTACWNFRMSVQRTRVNQMNKIGDVLV